MSLPIKVCGITRLEDAQAAIACGAQALGFIFHKPSPRYVTPEQARGIIAELPPFVVNAGVFVGESAQEMNRIAALCALDRIQLHGGEAAETLQAVERPAYRAFRLKEEGDVAAVEAAPDQTVLLDTFDPDQYGGTGRAFNWEWARRIGKTRRVILAGGLNPENVARALATAQPAALDVSTGVEAAPGIKDAERLASFFTAVKGHNFSTPSPWSTGHASAQ
ncbi:MAG: phosphoribosylanthranilate isomerase [SAR324 cluster bacterium]|nr:phosphoribosylanthranilate isomerase [SAR324 cluster bacterium]MCZ6842374.1 phosphoribosylanthranilate isomerase [SAR324 cluster bacterium]